MILNSLLLPRPRKLYMIVATPCRPLPIDESQVRGILTAYDLGPLRCCRRLAIGPTRSKNLVVEVGSGKKILKQYKTTMNIDGINYEHAVLKHLATNDFPAPRLVPNREGETCLEMEGKYYAIFDFIPGVSYVDYFIPFWRRRAFLTEAGRTLARYHQIMDGFVPAGRKLNGLTPDGERWWQGQDWYAAIFAEYEDLFKQRSDKSALDQFFLLRMDGLTQSFVELDLALRDSWDSLPKVVVHGDYRPGNLFFDRGNLVAVLDFECVHLGPRSTEVISALWRFTGQEVGFLNYDRARIFFQAYSSVCPLKAREIELMPDIFRWRRLRGLVYHLRDYLELGNPLKIRYAHQSVTWIDEMEKNGDQMVEFLQECSRAGSG